MENENTCVRCGKPCAEGEFMCPACQEWLDQQPDPAEEAAETAEETAAPETAETAEAPAAADAEDWDEAEDGDEDEEEEPETESKRCIFCAGTIPAEAEFCPLCGKDLMVAEAEEEDDGEYEAEYEYEYEEEEEEEERVRGPIGLIIGLCAAILLLLGALVGMFVLVTQERPAPPESEPSDTGLGMFEPAEGIPTPEELAQQEADRLAALEAAQPEAVNCRNCGVAITVEDPVCPFCDWDQSLDPADFVEIPLEVEITFGEELIGYTTLTPSDVTETSFLSQTSHDNVGALTVDGDLSTSWQEGVTGYGIGESVSYAYEDEVYVRGLALWTGNWREGRYYEQNGVPKLVNIYIGDTVLTVELPYTKECHYVVFNQMVPTNLIMLEISSVYEGSMYRDTCIAEVEIIGSVEKE